MEENRQMILIDTNIFIEVFKGNAQIEQLVRGLLPKELALSSITAMELYYGALNKLELPPQEVNAMATVKSQLAEIIHQQPEDATYEEILRELAFDHMVERGLADARKGNVITHEEMARRIRTWQK